MNFLRKFWDKETGGFFSATDPESLYNKSDVKMDLWVTSGCARAALYMGQLDIAIGAANWMENLMKLHKHILHNVMYYYGLRIPIQHL